MNYIDTSALIKAYVPEAGSEAFVTWADASSPRCISPLSALEMRSAVMRLQRIGLLDARKRKAVITAFDEEVEARLYRVLPWPARGFVDAREALDRCTQIALHSLDAMHLAVALHHGCRGFATADRAQAQAARRLGLQVRTFFS